MTLAREAGEPDLAQCEWLENLEREELERIAKFQFPQRLQRRMTQLLQKNQGRS